MIVVAADPGWCPHLCSTSNCSFQRRAQSIIVERPVTVLRLREVKRCRFPPSPGKSHLVFPKSVEHPATRVGGTCQPVPGREQTVCRETGADVDHLHFSGAAQRGPGAEHCV